MGMPSDLRRLKRADAKHSAGDATDQVLVVAGPCAVRATFRLVRSA
jgi:hypothetical protein